MSAYFDCTSFNEFSIDADPQANWGFDHLAYDWFTVTNVTFPDSGEICIHIIDSEGDFKEVINLPNEYSLVLNKHKLKSFLSRSWELNVSGNRIFLRELHRY